MASKSGKQKNLTKEEELLLQDFSRNVSTKSSALFYGNALIVSAIPMCKCILIDINFPMSVRFCHVAIILSGWSMLFRTQKYDQGLGAILCFKGMQIGINFLQTKRQIHVMIII